MFSPSFLMLVLFFGFCHAEPDVQAVRGSCKGKEAPTVVITDTGCTIKGTFWFNDKPMNYGVDDTCEDSGWLFSPTQPKPCEVTDFVEKNTYRLAKMQNTPHVTVIRAGAKLWRVPSSRAMGHLAMSLPT